MEFLPLEGSYVILRAGKVHNVDMEMNVSTFLKLFTVLRFSSNHEVSLAADNKGCLVSIRVNITVFPDYS